MLVKAAQLFFFYLIVCFLAPLSVVLAQAENKIILHGKVDTIPPAQYYISYKKNDVSVRDTLIVDTKGRFQYTTVYNEPLRVIINVDNTDEFPWYDPDVVGYHSVYDFWVDPGRETYFQGTKDGKVRVNSPTNDEEIRYRKARDSIRLLRKQSSAHILHDLDGVRREFIMSRPKNYYSLYLLHNILSEQEPDLQFIQDELEGLPVDLLQTTLAISIFEKTSVLKTLAIGQPLPDFKQSNAEQEIVKLSDFAGKYVLVDFWASWCLPCRRTHPHLVNAYEKYRDQGFEIVGVSLDEERGDWLKAIKDDGLTWTQLSDLQGPDNSVAKQFFIRSIPDNFLIDPYGVIIARGLQGKQLSNKLKEVFIEK